jgi:hypothetical protein
MLRSALRTMVRPIRDQRGVALPLALLGLISVSLLVTTALVTSSTELAISNAHQDATQALYVAEGGLQAYVATSGPALMADTGAAFVYQPPSGDAAEGVTVVVSYLGQQTRQDQSLLRVFSVQATPVQGGGRSVSTLVKQIIPPPQPLTTNITSALTLGGDLDVDGNSFTVNGRVTSNLCNGASVDAARIAVDSDINANNDSHMNNFLGKDGTTGWAAIERTSLTRDELARDVMGGKTLDELIAMVPESHRWGPRFAGDGPVRTWDGVVDTLPAPEKVAVVDANGGTVLVEGGKGVLIVVNGNIEMKGSARFDGIIIVEGSFWLHGTPQVVGALVSLSRDVQNRIDLNTEAEIDGHVTVQYDKCQIDSAENGFGQLTQPFLTPTVAGTFAWLEMTR